MWFNLIPGMSSVHDVNSSKEKRMAFSVHRSQTLPVSANATEEATLLR